jgi:hypothetical protein
VSNNLRPILIGAPAQANKLWVTFDIANAYQILSTSQLAAGTVMAVAPNALVSAMDPAPRFNLSTEVAVHMDTHPAHSALLQHISLLGLRRSSQADSSDAGTCHLNPTIAGLVAQKLDPGKRNFPRCAARGRS